MAAFLPWRTDTGRITADSGLFTADGGSIAGYSPGACWATGTWRTATWVQRAWAIVFVVGTPSTRRSKHKPGLFGGL